MKRLLMLVALCINSLCCYVDVFGNETCDNEISYDDAAAILAGSECRSGDGVAGSDYAEFVRNKWNKLCQESLGHVKSWAIKNIAHYVDDANVVFYPFGGPDVAYVTQFFPDADEYVLLGLEPIGSFNDVKKSLRSPTLLSALMEAMTAYLEKGYFITSEMMSQLLSKDIRGCCYLILLELSKLNYNIVSIEDISVNNDGIEVNRGNGALNFIKIMCKSPEGKLKKIYYAKIDLTNANPQIDILKKFMSRAKFLTFIKSASYALHDRSFSDIRQFIVDKSQAIFQDDTGVPFYFFDSKWDKRVFGKYTGPKIKIFKKHYQQSLVDYCNSHDVCPIPFKIGYGYSLNSPTLLLLLPTHRKFTEKMKSLQSKGGCPCKQNKNRNSVI